MNKVCNINEVAFDIGALAVQAMLYEVVAFPSPGLVSPISSGAHADMNLFTFIDSTSALLKHLIFCADVGLKNSNVEQVFSSIRNIGKTAEIDMFNKTRGVNTHKGMLFLMGICSSALAIVINNNLPFRELQQIIKKMTRGIVEKELSNINKHERALSHGEKLFLQHNITGIRGQVEAGLPIVFHYGVHLYEESYELSKNDRLIHTLIGIMQYCEDTTIVHRHSLDVLQKVKKKAEKIMEAGGMFTPKGREYVLELDEEFIEKKISPGGSADLLAVIVFLHEAKNKFNLK